MCTSAAQPSLSLLCVDCVYTLSLCSLSLSPVIVTTVSIGTRDSEWTGKDVAIGTETDDDFEDDSEVDRDAERKERKRHHDEIKETVMPFPMPSSMARTGLHQGRHPRASQRMPYFMRKTAPTNIGVK